MTSLTGKSDKSIAGSPNAAPKPVAAKPADAKPAKPAMTAYETQAYWQRRSDMLYYRYIDYIIRAIAVDARSMVDVGTGNCPYLEWFDWIPERVSIDIRTPYSSDSVKGIKGDIFKLPITKKYDICSCLQVLEHVPDAGAFGKRLLEMSDLVVVSVPYKWPTFPKVTTGHVHDPVDYEKLTGWMGRPANYKQVVQEPFSNAKSQRLIAIYDRDPRRKFLHTLAETMVRR